MQISKIVIHLPREFEVERIQVNDGKVELVPLGRGSKVLTGSIGYVVVEGTEEGKAIRKTSEIRFNMRTGELALNRLNITPKVAPPPRAAHPAEAKS